MAVHDDRRIRSCVGIRQAITPVVIFVYVQDVDQTVQRAIANGARVLDDGTAANGPVGYNCC